MVLDAQESYNCGKLEYCTTAVVESRRGFLRIAVTLAREGLAARFSESPHQVQIILIFFFAICLNPSKDTRPRRTENTVAGLQGRASTSGHLPTSPEQAIYR